MVLLKFYQAMKNPDLQPDSVVKWQQLVSSQLLTGKGQAYQMCYWIKYTILFLLVEIKIEISIQDGGYMRSLLFWFLHCYDDALHKTNSLAHETCYEKWLKDRLAKVFHLNV